MTPAEQAGETGAFGWRPPRALSLSEQIKQRLDGRRVIASVSGGKDSAALCLHLRELGVEHERVFMDTGWEHPWTYEYIRGELTRVLGPITELRAPMQMEELILAKGMFPSRQRRFCTQELKVFPMQRYLASLGADVVNAVGIRHEESAARAKMPEWEWSDGFDCEVWRPLAAWTEDDVIAIHRRHGLKPNPLYLKGASRVGCWPCIYARKSEIRLVAELDPERIERLRALEADVEKVARARYERDRAELIRGMRFVPRSGRTIRAHWWPSRERLLRPFASPTWFQAPVGRKGTWPIDKVVTWSKTAHGGKQFELFAAAGRDAGCVRWGLCETAQGSLALEDRR